MEVKLEKYNTIEINGKHFINVCESSDILEKKGIKIQFPEDDDFQVAIIRYDGKLHCMDNVCPHRHADRIFEGIIKNNTVTCLLHGWSYFIDTGENTNKHRGLKNLKKFEVFEENNKVYIEKPEFEIPKWRRF